jgi:hypothetical protein
MPSAFSWPVLVPYAPSVLRRRLPWTLGVMAIDLSPSNMLGHWTHVTPKICEYQYGQTMIYVSYDDSQQMEMRLAVAQLTIEEAFTEFDNVLKFAQQISENQNPEFWRNAKRISLKQNPLTVFAVRYPIDSELPIYEISWNPSFEVEEDVVISKDWAEEEIVRVEVPENLYDINVKRLGALSYAHIA